MTGMGAVVAAVLSFAVTSALGIVLIPYLRKLKYGQSIKEIGPVWHKSKQGTPVMGGLMFIIGIVISVAVILIFAGDFMFQMRDNERSRLIYGVLMALMFGFIGFSDDYIKVVKKRNLGLTAKQKFLLQVFAAVIFLVLEFVTGLRGTSMMVPFTNITLNLGIAFWPVALFIIVGTVNSVNLTDGVDGLAASVTTVVALALMLSAKIMMSTAFAAVAAALAGGCLGFLIWNFHPAKIFMGDTGSLFLGGLICAIAFGIDQPLLLIPFGIIYIVETMSDIIQVISFKSTGKRVFKMAPIHHHFEMSGWSEVKIVTVFTCVTIVFSIAGVAWLAYMIK
ncbi:MAG TPA: phospho-N-acetylmuramoyl-pentapeptide-transferase [Ruminiclostridium sp.]|nr:phospho-N-acetylmuramoyl-pentapeptide-transferase [Ruminiclostridium sp.]